MVDAKKNVCTPGADYNECSDYKKAHVTHCDNRVIGCPQTSARSVGLDDHREEKCC